MAPLDRMAPFDRKRKRESNKEAPRKKRRVMMTPVSPTVIASLPTLPSPSPPSPSEAQLQLAQAGLERKNQEDKANLIDPEVNLDETVEDDDSVDVVPIQKDRANDPEVSVADTLDALQQLREMLPVMRRGITAPTLFGSKEAASKAMKAVQGSSLSLLEAEGESLGGSDDDEEEDEEEDEDDETEDEEELEVLDNDETTETKGKPKVAAETKTEGKPKVAAEKVELPASKVEFTETPGQEEVRREEIVPVLSAFKVEFAETPTGPGSKVEFVETPEGLASGVKFAETPSPSENQSESPTQILDDNDLANLILFLQGKKPQL